MTHSGDTELDRQLKDLALKLYRYGVNVGRRVDPLDDSADRYKETLDVEEAKAQLKQLIARERLEFFNTGKAVGRNAVLEFMRLHPEMSSSEVQAALQAQADKGEQV